MPQASARIPLRRTSKTAANHAANDTKTTVIRRRRGSLQELLNMPIEIFSQILSYLPPRDLCSIVRTSRGLRDFLLSKKHSKFIWRDAWQRVEGFPVLPPLLSEPALAHLLYCFHCHGCGKGTTRKAILQWQKRYCKDCLKSRHEEWKQWYPEHPLSHDEFFKQLGGVCNVIFNFSTDGTRWFQIKQYEHFLQEWHDAEPTLEAKRQLYEVQATKKLEIAEYALSLSSWIDMERQARLLDLQTMKEERFRDICDRLRDEGWSAELDHILSQNDRRQRFRKIVSIRQAAQLTDKVFRKVFSDIEHVLQETRELLIANQQQERELRQDCLFSRLEELEAAIEYQYFYLDADVPCMPSAFDIVCDPEIEPLLRMPSTETVPSRAFMKVLPLALGRWKAKVRAELGAIVKAHVESIPDNIDPLELAVASFRCLYCSAQPLRYPSILAHPCDHTIPSWPGAPQEYNRDLQEVWSRHWDPTCRPVRLHPLVPEYPFGLHYWEKDILSSPKALLAVLDLPPETTVLQDVQDLRLECLSCNLHNDVYLYTWEAALSHFTDHDFQNFWRVASKDERNAAIEHDTDAHISFTMYADPSIPCPEQIVRDKSHLA